MQLGADAGLGLFSRVDVKASKSNGWWRWWPRAGGNEPKTVARFPLNAAITADTVCQDPDLGHTYR